MEHRRGFSLYGRLALLLVTATVLPLLVLGWQAIERNRAALTVDAQHFGRVLAERAAAQVQHQLDTAEATLTAIATTLGRADESNEAVQSQVAAAQLEAWGGSRFVTLYRPDGARVGSIRRDLDGTSPGPSELPPALRGEALRTGDVTTRSSGPVLPVSVPVHTADGTLRYFLFAEVELAPLARALSALGETPPLRDPQAIFIVDSQRRAVLSGGYDISGHSLFKSLAGDVRFHQPLTVVTDYDDETGRMLAAVTTIPTLGWAVVARQPEAGAYASLNALITSIIATVLVTALLALLAGLLGGRWLVRPLRALVSATKRIARREWTRVEPQVSARTDEVGTLARAVDSMSASLEASTAQLIHETRARTALARYLPADVVEQVVADPSKLQLGGQRRLITVLFADVVGFTQIAEHLPPERIVTVLNEYFTLATEIVHHHGGFVDKFIGDCVMAVWGLPEEKPDDAARALAAAEALARWTGACERRWQRKYGVHLQLAMGLNTGLVVAGNVGSERRLEYTVIGDTVNVAARLEATAAPGQILVSEATRQALAEPHNLGPLGERRLRGRTQSIRVYEVER